MQGYKRNTYIGQGMRFKSVKHMCAEFTETNRKYIQISSRISAKAAMKLCDITGLPALYKCPYTRLVYYDSSVYKRICEFSSENVQRLFKLKEFGKTLVPFKK
ncbi:hypothetical protein CWI42_041850 [Ordospora colligata]|uniref:Vps72/YL1 C-terminal domain-containing protein n=1 Tax=Ordospora colligata OC4 TaxID=1354746 RepID=A0A0B2UKU4_9MICR|nr:uncharacterized protein M896_041860 [Ordospora colligata OC4]KHN69988.1 hypothetical protein M896_041860 [Ordospora colligata OC4]TBU16158.1 hypothetical protein CWI41_041850 [Ordospora colligata]TBU16371.1 hypothetical protein CWI40_041850 [Ordospora colligata]TBU19075.1 hypothetical protein CWI42_041850 [Ordospora colligata]